jgi:hypothetical protein
MPEFVEDEPSSRLGDRVGSSACSGAGSKPARTQVFRHSRLKFPRWSAAPFAWDRQSGGPDRRGAEMRSEDVGQGGRDRHGPDPRLRLGRSEPEARPFVERSLDADRSSKEVHAVGGETG